MEVLHKVCLDLSKGPPLDSVDWAVRRLDDHLSVLAGGASILSSDQVEVIAQRRVLSSFIRVLSLGSDLSEPIIELG